MRLLPLRRKRNLYQIFIKHFCPFYKRPEQSATPKDIPPCGEKTFALRVRVALMNILILIKKTKKSLTKLSYYVRVI
jgi:hypothetical protein